MNYTQNKLICNMFITSGWVDGNTQKEHFKGVF